MPTDPLTPEETELCRVELRKLARTARVLADVLGTDPFYEAETMCRIAGYTFTDTGRSRMQEVLNESEAT